MSDGNIILNYIVSITESRDIEILEMSLLRTIFEVCSCKRVYLFKASADKPSDRTTSGYGIEGYSSSYDLEPDADFLKLAENFIIDPEKFRKLNPNNDSSYIIIPVDILSNQIGFIAVEKPESTAFNNQILIGLVKIYQNYVSILLDNQTDTLTGILNRKTFDDRIMKLIEIKKRQKREICLQCSERRAVSPDRFWLGIFDIDDFKKVNDTFGHIYGDEILILISRIIQKVFRTSDMKFRFGGEEFIIVIKAENSEDAFSVFERFRKEVENYAFPQTGQITISTGIVEITGSETPSVFVGCADNALYYAKHNGKNMTCIYSDLVEQGLIKPPAVQKGDIILFDD